MLLQINVFVWFTETRALHSIQILSEKRNLNECEALFKMRNKKKKKKQHNKKQTYLKWSFAEIKFQLVERLTGFAYHACASVWKEVGLYIIENNNNNNEKRAAPSKNVPFNARLTKTQISLRLRAVLSEFVVCMKKPCILAIQNPPSEESDQTARMRSLIWIFAGRTYLKVRCRTLRLIWIRIWNVNYPYWK